MPWSVGHDLLALWTDGLVDARNDADEPFGEARLLGIVCRHRNEPAETSLQAVLDEFETFGAHPADDRTLLFSGSDVPRAKRRLGQHFLSDPRILQRIADALESTRGDTVLEIGPGPGRPDRGARRARAGRMVAIEKDRRAGAGLRRDSPRSRWWRATLSSSTGTPSAAPVRLVIGNIPYNITSPLIDKALDATAPAAHRVPGAKGGGGPGERRGGEPAYGALSVGVQAVARAERLFVVPAGAFHPRPKVDSAVLRLTPFHPPLVTDAELPTFRRMTVGLFSFRRKQLGRGLRELTGWTPERVARRSPGRRSTRSPGPRPWRPRRSSDWKRATR